MKAKRARTAPDRKASPGWNWADEAALLTAGLACWTWVCLQRPSPGGGPLSFPVWGRGVLMLLAALATLRLMGLKTLLSRLFPVLWLTASMGLGNLCAPGAVLSWAWAMMAMASLLFARMAPDGRILLLGEAPLWLGMTWVMRSSLLMPLAFLLPFHLRLKKGGAVFLGGLVSTVLLFGAFRAWRDPGFLMAGWLDAYDFVFARHALAFVILAFLAYAGRTDKGFGRSGILQVFLALAGWALWAPPFRPAVMMDAMKVTFIWLSGIGLETMKNELLDDSWHGRLVWAVVGSSLFLALFKGA